MRVLISNVLGAFYRRIHLPLIAAGILLVFATGCARQTLSNSSNTKSSDQKELKFTQGLAYEALSNYSRAITYFKEVINFSGNSDELSARARLRIARIHNNQLNDSSKAIENYEIYLDKYDDQHQTESSDDVLIELARVHQEQGNVDTAVEVYTRIRKNFPESSVLEETLYNLAEIKLKQDEYDTAIKNYNSLLDKYPNGSLADGALFNLAKAYGEIDRPNKELETYIELLESFPESDLREVVLYLTVQKSSILDRGELSNKWGSVYLNEYENGQYVSDIKSILESEDEETADSESSE